MKTPLSPSQFLDSGYIFGFGGMCQELMDTPTPTSISLSVPHATSSGDWLVKWPAAQYTSATQGKRCSFLLSSLLFFSGQSGTYSLCEVCNLQLTSAAQAQLHYNGRSHLRRVRQLQAGDNRQQAAGLSCDCRITAASAWAHVKIVFPEIQTKIWMERKLNNNQV